nr:hypothetical protein [Streptomyces antibioticus]
MLLERVWATASAGPAVTAVVLPGVLRERAQASCCRVLREQA